MAEETTSVAGFDESFTLIPSLPRAINPPSSIKGKVRIYVALL